MFQRPYGELVLEKSEEQMTTSSPGYIITFHTYRRSFLSKQFSLGSLSHWHDCVSAGRDPQGVNICLTHLEGNLSIYVKNWGVMYFSIISGYDNCKLFNDSFIDFSHKFIEHHHLIKCHASISLPVFQLLFPSQPPSCLICFSSLLTVLFLSDWFKMTKNFVGGGKYKPH